MVRTPAKKTSKTTAKRAPAKPAVKRGTAKPAGTTTPAKRPVGRPAANKQPGSTATPAKAVKAVKAAKPKKPKVVRDSFTMPETEYALIGSVKKACLSAGFEIKKSEILRIGVTLIAKLDPKKVKAAQAALVPLKAGRPKKHK